MQCKIQPVLLMGLWLTKVRSEGNMDTFILVDGKQSNYNLKHLPNYDEMSLFVWESKQTKKYKEMFSTELLKI